MSRAGLGALVGTILALVLAGAIAAYLAKEARRSVEEAEAMTGGDIARGRAALWAQGCGTCHSIPGVRDAGGRVGPPLAGLVGRAYIAGVLPNTPQNLRAWIEDPQRIDGRTAMPATGVTDAEARDIAAFLYTLQ